MKKKGLRLKGRMMIVFMATAIIADIPAIICLNRLKTTVETYNEVLKYDGFAQGHIGKVVANLSVMDSLAHDMVSFEQEENTNDATNLRKIELESYKNNLKVVEEHLGDEESKKYYDEAKKKMDVYLKKADDLIEYGLKNDASDLYNYAEVEKMITKELNPIYDDAYAAWNKLLEYKENKGNEISDNLKKDNKTLYIGIIIATTVSVLIAIIFGYFCAKTVIEVLTSGVKRLKGLVDGDLKSEVPDRKVDDELKDLLDAIRNLRVKFGEIIGDQDYVLDKMANGDFTAHTRKDENYVGDFGNLLVSLRNIRGKLSESLGEIDEAAEQVGVGSQQVASGAQELAQGATEQASAVEQLNATLDVVANEIKENAKKAADTRKLAKSTEGEIEEGNRQMQEMTQAMAEISDTSNKIAKIIKTIDDIAFQTNILALNAAVEAARAGSAGKGFAVVADEVRNLAGKSAEAAKNTTELIESSIKAVENGTQIADRTAATLNNVVISAQKSAEIVDEMAHSSEEQAQSIEEITKGIEQISAVVQTNSATSEESAAASEELSCQAEKMRNMIAKFKIRRNSKDDKFDSFQTSNTKVDTSDFSSVKDIKLDEFDLDLGGKY